MTTMLLAAMTVLLALILVVLVHHMPKEEWIALLDMGLRICWVGLGLLGPITLAAITIVWEARNHQEPPFLVESIPFFFLLLSIAAFSIVKRYEYTFWKRRVVQFILMAFGLLIYAWWDPIPPLWSWPKAFANGPFADIFAWTGVLLFSYFVVEGIREEWPSRVAPPARELDDPQQGRQAERILVVDDEETLRGIISSMLVSAGYRCRAVAGGLEALALLESGEKFELLLTDLLNAPMDGFSLLERMKKSFPDVAVVMVTSIRDDAVAQACLRDGAYDYLLKPFEREQLLTVVRRALERGRLERASSGR